MSSVELKGKSSKTLQLRLKRANTGKSRLVVEIRRGVATREVIGINQVFDRGYSHDG
ncbi:MAG TPA: hypothetical protein VK961_07885 [Chthoniobacter sp.]|nr:hypothetical protein [Chthoniobacter sp.]